MRFKWDGATIRMEEGQSMSFHKIEDHDEGWGYRAWTLEISQGVLRAECSSGGSDCDGRIDRYVDMIYIDGQWEVETESQRDQYAEMDGY